MSSFYSGSIPAISNPPGPRAVRLVTVLVLGVLILLLVGCRENGEETFLGYVEGEYLHISSPIGGRLEALHVSRGMTVAADEKLFTLDQTVEAAGVAEAEQGLHRAEKQLADLSKGLRPSEIAAIEARLEQARASHELARIEYERREQLARQKVVSKDVLDRTRTEMELSGAAITQLQAELETASLGARPDAIEAAKAEVEAARQRLVQARWRLEQQVRTAPVQALVFDTFYEEGEHVPPGYPVVSLLPPGNVKIRFFVPEPVVGTLRAGQQVSVSVDGAGTSYRAAISFISPRAEYTPPVIYSRKSRSHLVFMVEATPDPAAASELHPGQPLEVHLEPPDA